MNDETRQTATSPEEGPPPGDVQALDLTGRKIGDYQLIRRLGQGGMGQVYLAEQVSLKRKVALKLLRSDLAANSAALERFKREAMAVARATHANIVQVYAIGEDNGLHFMALEYVEGRNLRDYLEKKGPPEPLIARSILRQAASALQRASELGVIHRDIKPENILVTRKGEVKVADFGLSRIFGEDQQPLNITQSGITMGTPLYMSPEQVEGKPLDPRTDIYSLGVTAYYMLCGEPPFRGQTSFEVAIQHVQKEPPPLNQIRPDLPADLCAIVHKMMAKKPENRYQTAQEIVRDLSLLRDPRVGVGQTAITAGPTSPGLVPSGLIASDPALPASGTSASNPLLAPPLVRRHFPWLAVTVLLLMLGAGAALGVWWSQHKKEGPGPAAKQEVIDPEKKEEEEWLKQFKKYEKAQNPADIGQGIYAAVKLGALYLHRDQRKDARDFKEAENFFQQLRQLPLNESSFPYIYFGRLGEAIVLSFRDEEQKSNELFTKLFKKKPASPEKPAPPEMKVWLQQEKALKEYLNKNIDFRKMLAQALQRNYENSPATFPSQLDQYRVIPTGGEPKKTMKVS